MTTIHDYIDSIRQSLATIEAKYAAGERPGKVIEQALVNLDVDAEHLAKCGRDVK